MKKPLFFALFILLATTSYAQKVVEFMGFPIDGTKAEMFSKLKENGFRETDAPNILEGLFEGLPVEVVVLDNSRDKVYEMDLRHEMGSDEALAIKRYNSLLFKFRNDPKYNDSYSELIPEGEPIGEKLRSESHLYSACFTQVGTNGYARVELLKSHNWKDDEKYKMATFVIAMKFVNAVNSPNG